MRCRQKSQIQVNKEVIRQGSKIQVKKVMRLKKKALCIVIKLYPIETGMLPYDTPINISQESWQ